jgi:hypothetical protein
MERCKKEKEERVKRGEKTEGKRKKVNQWKNFSENDGNGYNLKKTGLIVNG